MKIWNRIILSALFTLTLSAATLAQQAAVQLPRESPRAEVAQTVGDTRIAIVYHRPSVKNRALWGCQTNDMIPKGGVTYPCLVPSNQVWRVGANENTTFEVSENVKINGQDLPAGKYGFHAIPNKDEWTLIFNKVNNEWGSYRYDEKQDQLRVKTKPQTVADSRETMLIEFESIKPTATNVVIEWEKLRVPFTVEVGDVQTRVLGKLRQQISGATDASNAQAYLGSRVTAASFILDNKIKSAYQDASGWLDESLKVRENFNILRTKARLAAEMGNYKDAVTYGDKAVTVAKAAQPPVNPDTIATFEKEVTGWRNRK